MIALGGCGAKVGSINLLPDRCVTSDEAGFEHLWVSYRFVKYL